MNRCIQWHKQNDKKQYTIADFLTFMPVRIKKIEKQKKTEKKRNEENIIITTGLDQINIPKHVHTTSATCKYKGVPTFLY